jgi:transcription elongation GreA/GreB family factor
LTLPSIRTICFSMSRAFVRDQDGDEVVDDLPERPVSEHPNFVTSAGLTAIEAEVERLHTELDAAGDDRALRARILRDLRYWQARRATAEVVAPPADGSEVRFGSTVTIERDDGRRQTWRIVGEDEADPARGTVSHVSPLARALVGKSVGETAEVAGGEVEIVKIA